MLQQAADGQIGADVQLEERQEAQIRRRDGTAVSPRRAVPAVERRAEALIVDPAIGIAEPARSPSADRVSVQEVQRRRAGAQLQLVLELDGRSDAGIIAHLRRYGCGLGAWGRLGRRLSQLAAGIEG